MSRSVLKQLIVCFTWFCASLATYLPAPAFGDVCYTEGCEDTYRTRVAYVVAGLTVIGLAAGIACLGTASGHHHHHSRCSGMSSVDNYRPYSSSCSHHSHSHCSDYSDCYSSYYDSCTSSDSHHHHRSGSYDSYSDFSRNSYSSFSSDESRNFVARGKVNPTEEKALSGRFITHGGESVTPFIQLPDGTTHSLGRIAGNGSIPYGPYSQTGSYTFGVSLDQANETSHQLKLGSFQIEVNESTVQKVDFTAPPHAPNNYEPSPVYYHLN